MPRKYLSSLILLIIFLLPSCKDKKEELKPTPLPDTLAVIPKEPEINYYYYTVEGLITLTNLEEEFGEERKRIVLALNRLDSRHIKTGDSLIVPDTVYNDIMPYSPFPKELTILNDVPKFLIFSYPIQAFAAYEYGFIVMWGPTSLGKKSTPTPTGLFHTNWKAKVTISTVDSAWILPWAFNIENFQGVSLHQYDLPGYPASHACARLLEEDAEWIYYWADQWILTRDEESIIAHGTPVIIYGGYDYNELPPWKKLVENPKASDLITEELVEIINEYLPVIKRRVEIRDSVITVRGLVLEQ